MGPKACICPVDQALWIKTGPKACICPVHEALWIKIGPKACICPVDQALWIKKGPKACIRINCLICLEWNEGSSEDRQQGRLQPGTGVVRGNRKRVSL
jgi:hypothetical protein